ncbi:type VI secretion system baseplate subunit TssF [Acinetobacter pragensis]|uniref:Type VI secretion system protein ImpG n=1 Tax=Acinetobacter pragensis TaxID=1806892 RepID=A0A151Y2W8_9GAMM|nr:type VI secretion system baseplate subunit TssF [Acinetobacter pragensis]KYQ72391.1 type VI secretion system protein ImpG [Acinetobacter pragensis]
MIEELLPYYEKQLQEFAQQSREFAQKYPKIAQRLSLNQEQIDDPHIERLIQAFSLISARIDKKLDDSYDVFTRSIFEVMFPQYLKPFPASSVISFDDMNKIKQLSGALSIPRGTALKSKSIRGVQCEYSTVQEVRLLPIVLKQLHFKAHPTAHIHLNQNATISLDFEIFNQLHAHLTLEKLPIYLDAISNFPLQVLDSIFKATTSFSIQAGQQTFEIANPFELAGFAEQQSILPLDQHTHQAYRLLMEYFCCPEKYNFLTLNLGFLHLLDAAANEFEVQVHFKMNLNDQAALRNYTELNAANFKLFCTPAVNLFKKQAEPQKIDHKRMEYPLLTDAHHPEYYQAYSILSMKMIREKSGQDQAIFPVLPFFSMNHYHQEQANFYYCLNTAALKNKNQALSYSLLSKHLAPQSTQSDFISIELLCSNQDLPYESYNKEQNVLTLNDSSLARRALMLKRPNPPYYFEQNKQEQWRIISHLSLNMMSLMNGDGVAHLKELLELYNLPKSRENQILIEAIQTLDFELTQKLVDSQPFPLFVRGVKVRLGIQAEIFRGHSIYIFSQLLAQVFNLKVQMNSYVDVTVYDIQSQQELYQCMQNVGGKKLL